MLPNPDIFHIRRPNGWGSTLWVDSNRGRFGIWGPVEKKREVPQKNMLRFWAPFFGGSQEKMKQNLT